MRTLNKRPRLRPESLSSFMILFEARFLQQRWVLARQQMEMLFMMGDSPQRLRENLTLRTKVT